LKCYFCIFHTSFCRTQNCAKLPQNKPPTPRTSDRCNDPAIFQKNVFFRVKRGRIQDKARTWKRGLKCPV
jgi:hypothetical protein